EQNYDPSVLVSEQKLQDSNSRFKKLQRFSENQKHQLEESQRNVSQSEEEKLKAISECKAANERLDKLHLELAFMERSLEEEKESKRSLLNYKDQEINQSKDTIEQVTVLRSQYQQQIYDLQNELQSIKMNEYQLKNKLTISDAEIESLKAQITSMESEVKQWQNVAKSTSDSKNKEIHSLNSKVESLSIELEEVRQRSSNFEKSYKEQVIIAQRAVIEKDDRERYHGDLIEKLMNEGKSLKNLSEIYEKRQEEDTQTILRLETEISTVKTSLAEATSQNGQLYEEIQNLKEEISKLEEEKKSLSQLSSVMSASPSSAVEKALQKKGQSIIQMYSDYKNIQEQLILEQKRSRELSEALTTFKFELENYAPQIQQRNDEYNQLLEENYSLVEQLKLSQSEMQRLTQIKENVESENAELIDRNDKLQSEKEIYMDHNASLMRQIEELRKGGPSSPVISAVDADGTIPRDIDGLYRLSFNLKSEKNVLFKKNKALENEIGTLREKLVQKDSEYKNAAQEISRLQLRQRQLHTQIEQEKRSLQGRSLLSSLSDQGSPSRLSSSMLQMSTGIQSDEKLQAEYQDVKNRLEIALEEMKVRDKDLQKVNLEMTSLRFEKTQLSHDVKHWEDRYQVLQKHYDMRNEEIQNMKQILRQTQLLNEQMEKQMIMSEEGKSALNSELTNAKNELNIRQTKWEEIQANFNKEMENLLAAKEKAELAARESQYLSGDKQRLERELEETKEKMISAQTRSENLQEQFNDMSTKYSSLLTKTAEERAKLIETNSTLQKSVNDLSEEKRNLSETIEAKIKEIQQCKEQLALFDSSDQGARISQLKTELENIEKENSRLLEDSKTYKELYEKYQADLDNSNRLYFELKSATDAEREEKMTSIKELQDELQQLKEKNDELTNKTRDLTVAHDELVRIKQSLDETIANNDAQEQRLREEMKRQEQMLEDAQTNYNRELVAHAAVVQQSHELNEKYIQLNTELEQLKNQLKNTESTLKNEKEQFEKDLADVQNRCNELESENKVLHGYIDTNSSEKTPQDEIISLLRREKEKLAAQKEIFSQQAERFKAQFEQTQKSLDETRELLAQERERAKDSESFEKQQAELLEKRIQMKILDESNQTLRAEREKLEQKATTLQSSIKTNEERIQALEAQTRILNLDRESALQEVKILQEDNERWKNRFQAILQKYGISDPAELQDLKENLKNASEERDKLRTEVVKLKKQFDNARVAAGKFRAEWQNIKAKMEQIEKEKSQLTQENLRLEKEKEQITQELQTEKSNNEKIKKHYANIAKSNAQKQAQSSEEIMKKLTESQSQNQDLAKELEASKNQYQEVHQQLEESKKELKEEKERTIMRFKAQESMYSGKMRRLETENTDLKGQIQQLQKSEEARKSSEGVPEVAPAVETTTSISLPTPEVSTAIPQIAVKSPVLKVSDSIPKVPAKAETPVLRSSESENSENVTQPINMSSTNTAKEKETPKSPSNHPVSDKSDASQAAQSVNIDDGMTSVATLSATATSGTSTPTGTIATAGAGTTSTTSTAAITDTATTSTGNLTTAVPKPAITASATSSNVPREKPPVKLQRNRGLLPQPTSPHATPYQSPSITVVEEQKSNQTQVISGATEIIKREEAVVETKQTTGSEVPLTRKRNREESMEEQENTTQEESIVKSSDEGPTEMHVDEVIKVEPTEQSSESVEIAEEGSKTPQSVPESNNMPPLKKAKIEDDA
ncbi:5729_t:CDS:10, partial [Acaulospora colombiana]